MSSNKAGILAVLHLSPGPATLSWSQRALRMVCAPQCGSCEQRWGLASVSKVFMPLLQISTCAMLHRLPTHIIMPLCTNLLGDCQWRPFEWTTVAVVVDAPACTTLIDHLAPADMLQCVLTAVQALTWTSAVPPASRGWPASQRTTWAASTYGSTTQVTAAPSRCGQTCLALQDGLHGMQVCNTLLELHPA